MFTVVSVCVDLSGWVDDAYVIDPYAKLYI